jgi:hypothetical protein
MCRRKAVQAVVINETVTLNALFFCENKQMKLVEKLLVLYIKVFLFTACMTWLHFPTWYVTACVIV